MIATDIYVGIGEEPGDTSLVIYAEDPDRQLRVTVHRHLLSKLVYETGKALLSQKEQHEKAND